MKNIPLILTLLFFLPAISYSQNPKFNAIGFTHMDATIFRKEKFLMGRQYLIDFDNQKCYHRKKPRKKYKEITGEFDFSFLADSMNYARLKQLSPARNAIDGSKPPCIVHYEKGYTKVEYLLAGYRHAEHYSEGFLIGHSYNCLDSLDIKFIDQFKQEMFQFSIWNEKNR